MDNNHLEQYPLSDLAHEFGTPLYVYSQTAMTEALAHYRHAFGDDVLICFAVKANGNLSVLRHFAQLGAGFDLVSGGELQRALTAGGDARKMIFSGVGKDESEIELALKSKIRCLNVESISELHHISRIASRMHIEAPVALRINPDVDAKTHPYISTGLKENKFGIAYNQAIEAFKIAASLPCIKVCGIDCHIGSQITEFSPFLDACTRLITLYDQLCTMGIVPEHLDLGGGIGVTYCDESIPPLQDYAQGIRQLIGNRPLTLILEPGRSLVANAGLLLTRVRYLKKNEQKCFAIVDAAMNDLMRPSLYQAYHNVTVVTPEESLSVEHYDIVGPICESGDTLAHNRALAIREGSLLAIHSCGAYAASMASQYNARPRAAELMVNGNQARLIRRRETIDDLLRLEMDYLQ